MSTVIVFSEEITLFIKKDNSLGYILSDTIPISEETNKIVIESANHTNISKLYNLGGAIVLLNLSCEVIVLYDRSGKFTSYLQDFNNQLVKDVFFYSGSSEPNTYLYYFLFNDNTIKGYARGLHRKLTSYKDCRDYYDVLAVDIDSASVQILKTNGIKIIFTSAGRTVIENGYDKRLECDSYI